MISEKEFYEKYNITKLDETVKITDFDCGDDDLNDFIRNEALLYKNQLIAMPYVLYEKDNPQNIVAYFTLSNDKIAVSDFSTNSQFNKFKKKNFVKEKYLRGYPSVKIGRLAVNKTSCGMGIGTRLLRFIESLFTEDNKTGCRFVTVDAYKNAAKFYQTNGFDFLQAQDEEPTQLMFFDLMTV